MTTQVLELLKKQAQLDLETSNLSNILNSAERGSMGLTLDSAKTDDWKAAKSSFSKKWKEYQEVNKALNKLRKAIGFEIVNGKRVTIYKYK